MVYPTTNRRQGLTIDYHAIKRQIGAYLELGYSEDEFDDEQFETVEDVIRDGMALYYFPPILEQPYAVGMEVAHEWSFLRPTWMFSTQDNQRRYVLPQDLERPIGEITFPDEDNSFYTPIKFTSPSRLRSLEYQNESTTYPIFAAIEPGETSGVAPQELVLVLHPTPDRDYNLSLQYQSFGVPISPDNPFPVGGQAHGPAILQACLAVAEMRKTGEEGPQWRRFMQMLAANVSRDHKRGARLIGYNQNGQQNSFIARGEARRLGGLYYNNGLYQNTLFDG